MVYRDYGGAPPEKRSGKTYCSPVATPEVYVALSLTAVEDRQPSARMLWSSCRLLIHFIATHVHRARSTVVLHLYVYLLID